MTAVRTWFRRSVSLEAAALLVGAGFFLPGFLIAFIAFWGRELEIDGWGSLGSFVALGGAIVAVLAMVVGRLAVAPLRARRLLTDDGLTMPDDRLRWYDLAAMALAYAFTALLGWQGVAALAAMSFTDAPVYAFPGAILVAVAFALTAYICFLSATSLTPLSLSLVLAVFLVVGAFASMITATDKHWWRDNLSALGMASNDSRWIFNGTLIVAGIIVTILARYATAGLPVTTHARRRGRRVVRAGLVTMGVLLAAVGVFPVDAFFLVHNTVATGMAVAFAGVVIALPWLIPGISRVFLAFGFAQVAVIVLLAIFFATGYYNLTAVELVAAVLIFSWIIVFLRTAQEDEHPGDAAADAAESGALTGS